MTKEQLDEFKSSLTIEDVFSLVAELGGEPRMIDSSTFISATICHNATGGSHKLYFYLNSGQGGLFHCYSGCEDPSFDIFELVQRVFSLRTNNEFSLVKAINYVLRFFNVTANYNSDFEESSVSLDFKYFKNLTREKQEDKRIELAHYNPLILRYLPRPIIAPWIKENISQEVMNEHNICYDPVAEAIVIPHEDKEGKLLGIRQRTLIKEQEEWGKYRPWTAQNTMYRHPLAFNLYNLKYSKENIKKYKKAVVFEGEKATLQFRSIFGKDNDISVATCGSSFITYQFQLLVELGVEEIIIAYDRQFKEIGDTEFKTWTKKLEKISEKFSPYVTISFMFDKWNLLPYKASPIDLGRNIFIELYKRRFTL